MTFKAHIQNLAQKLRLKLGFYFRNRACFSLVTKKKNGRGYFSVSWIMAISYICTAQINICTNWIQFIMAHLDSLQGANSV